tara:strand:- start:60 stop:239 length:180 start_codon:yes stop_codon:yes gene_type:complete
MDMSKMKNYLMDIESWCDGYVFGGDEFDIDEVAHKVNICFGSTMAADYAKDYLKRQHGE